MTASTAVSPEAKAEYELQVQQAMDRRGWNRAYTEQQAALSDAIDPGRWQAFAEWRAESPTYCDVVVVGCTLVDIARGRRLNMFRLVSTETRNCEEPALLAWQQEQNKRTLKAREIRNMLAERNAHLKNRYADRWRGRLPDALIVQQVRWEMRKAASRMYSMGFTYKQVGIALGCQAAQALLMVQYAVKENTSPVEAYFTRLPAILRMNPRELTCGVRAMKLVTYTPIAQGVVG